MIWSKQSQTRKEAKQMALLEAIASAKTRVEGPRTSIQQQQTKKQEFPEFLSRQSLALAASEGKSNESIEQKDEIQEAISWYNRILGFHVEGGREVKFTFKNINMNNPNEEYTFTIRHENNTYTWSSVLTTVEREESAFVSASAPVLSMLSARCDSTTEETNNHVEAAEGNTHINKKHIRRRVKLAVPSPGSASSVCQSPRLKAMK